jgi:hypothetical protein
MVILKTRRLWVVVPLQRVSHAMINRPRFADYKFEVEKEIGSIRHAQSFNKILPYLLISLSRFV